MDSAYSPKPAAIERLKMDAKYQGPISAKGNHNKEFYSRAGDVVQ